MASLSSYVVRLVASTGLQLVCVWGGDNILFIKNIYIIKIYICLINFNQKGQVRGLG